MAVESLSDHCSLMARQGGPPKPSVRPADCPKDAAYIKAIGGGAFTIPGSAPFPIVFEGGDGDDKVTVVGDGHAGVLVRGGRGNDSLTVESDRVWLAERIGSNGLLLIAAMSIAFAALVAIIWRALDTDKPGR